MFTEGKETEPNYLQHLYRRHRDRVVVMVDEFHGGPLQLVKAAAARRRSDLRDERKGRGSAFDEYWCIFDVDEHPNVPEALVMAGGNSIRVAVSNPCIELWFVLHAEDWTKHVHRHAIQDRCTELHGFGKTLNDTDVARLMEQFDSARSRAQRLDGWHHGNGSPPGSNPSTSVHPLIERIIE